MEGISFESDTEQPMQNAATISKKPMLIRWVLSAGLAQTEKSAEYVLLGIAGGTVVLAVFVWVLSAPRHQSQAVLNQSLILTQHEHVSP